MAEDVVQQGSSNGGAAHAEDHDQSVVIEAVQSLQDTQREILAALQTFTEAVMAMASQPAPAQAPLPVAVPNPRPNRFPEVRAPIQVPSVVLQANGVAAGSAT
ncbi:hypothetical protein CsSME_00015097 [Camellia sinensis var. sinensis]